MGKKLVKEAVRLIYHDILDIQPRGMAYGMVYGRVLANSGIPCLDTVDKNFLCQQDHTATASACDTDD